MSFILRQAKKEIQKGYKIGKASTLSFLVNSCLVKMNFSLCQKEIEG